MLLGFFVFALLIFFIVRSATWQKVVSEEKRKADQYRANLDKMPELRCPQHKWVYDANERLICDWCKMRPGSVLTKNGEY